MRVRRPAFEKKTLGGHKKDRPRRKKYGQAKIKSGVGGAVPSGEQSARKEKKKKDPSVFGESEQAV